MDKISAKDGGFLDAVVLQRASIPESNHIGVDPAISGSDGVALPFSSEDEKWIVICPLEHGDIEPIEAEKEIWAKYDKGATVQVEYSLGRISGDIFLGTMVS